MPRLRKPEPAVSDEMPERLRRFVPTEWGDPNTAMGKRYVYHAMCDYGRARLEWFETNLGVSREEAWRLSRADNNSGKIGYWTVLGNSCRVAELSVEAGLGDWPEFCQSQRQLCPCSAAGKVVAVDGAQRRH